MSSRKEVAAAAVNNRDAPTKGTLSTDHENTLNKNSASDIFVLNS